MAEGKNLKASSGAADVVSSVISYDHGAPSNSEMSQVTGVTDGPAADYSTKLSRVGGQLEEEFRKLLNLVLADCNYSKQSIEQMQDLDSEIAAALNVIDSEVCLPDPLTGASTGSKDTQW